MGFEPKQAAALSASILDDPTMRLHRRSDAVPGGDRGIAEQ